MSQTSIWEVGTEGTTSPTKTILVTGGSGLVGEYQPIHCRTASLKENSLILYPDIRQSFT